jgi:azurin
MANVIYFSNHIQKIFSKCDYININLALSVLLAKKIIFFAFLKKLFLKMPKNFANKIILMQTNFSLFGLITTLLLGFSNIGFGQALQDTTITIKILGGLQYDLPRFSVKPNTKVTVVLDNHDDMAHNIVFTKPNNRLKVVNDALKLAELGAKLDYVPNSTLVLAHSKVIEPGRLESFSFVVGKAGIYPYVCTYPGHGFIMYGAMYVGKNMPDLAKDLNVPEGQRTMIKEVNASHGGHQVAVSSPHPYPLQYPMLYRVFMPEASPAAIAVALSATEAYCFDAGKCYLRYAWSGGFVDNAEHWKGNGNKLAKIVGKVYWRDSTSFPFKIGSELRLPVVHFKGYSLKNRLPTFRYLLDEIEVLETITLNTNSEGITRKFVFKNNKTLMTFFKNGTKAMAIPAGTATFTSIETR